MNSLKFDSLQDVSSDQLQNTGSSFVVEGTQRRRIYESGTPRVPRRSPCLVCGGPTSKRAATCRDCYNKARNADVTMVCAFCQGPALKKAYEVQKALKRGHTDVYCSQTCSQAHHAVKNRRRCLVCSGPCPKKTMKYCSEACSEVVRLTRRSLAERACPTCQTMFRPQTSRRQYCSRKCANHAHSIRMRGGGNSWFRAGDSPTKVLNEIRPSILDRDEHQCRACAATEDLCVHHIDEDPANNTPENLITICRACHHLHHKSRSTPFPWFAEYAAQASRSMTSK